eukprot:1191492-Alexandrium_andersonii.AAC.1
MSASLVGSEMCIRDRSRNIALARGGWSQRDWPFGRLGSARICLQLLIGAERRVLGRRPSESAVVATGPHAQNGRVCCCAVHRQGLPCHGRGRRPHAGPCRFGLRMGHRPGGQSVC